MAARLWLLCGLPFAGKSTVCRHLVQHGVAAVSLDAINEERGVGFGGDGLAPSVWGESLEIGLQRIDAAMKHGLEVVVDDTSCFRWLRDRYRAVADRHGYRTILVYLDVAPHELQRRRVLSERCGDRRGIRDEVFEAVLATFETPTADESPQRLLPGDDVEPWLCLRRGSERWPGPRT